MKSSSICSNPTLVFIMYAPDSLPDLRKGGYFGETHPHEVMPITCSTYMSSSPRHSIINNIA